MCQLTSYGKYGAMSLAWLITGIISSLGKWGKGGSRAFKHERQIIGSLQAIKANITSRGSSPDVALD